METQKIIEKINQAYVNIQNLGIQPTKTNCELIMGALKALDQAAEAVTQMENQLREAEAKLQEREGPESEEEA